jgi:hypothetical protein
MSRAWAQGSVPAGHCTQRQAAEELEVSQRTVRSMLKTGDLFGRRVRVGPAGSIVVVDLTSLAVAAVRRAAPEGAALGRRQRSLAALARGRIASIEKRQAQARARAEANDLAQLAGQLVEVAGAPAVAAALEAVGIPGNSALRSIPPGWRAPTRAALVRLLRHH